MSHMGMGNSQSFFTLRTKFLILFVLLITVPFLLGGYIIYTKYTSSVEANIHESANQVIEQILLSLDTRIKELDKITAVPLYELSVLDVLRSHNQPYQNFHFNPSLEVLAMNLFMSSLTAESPEIKEMSLYANDGSLYSSYESNLPHWEKRNSVWMDRVSLAMGRIVIFPPLPAEHAGIGGNSIAFSVSRVIREPGTNKQLAFARLDLTTQFFESIVSKVSLSPNSHIYITQDDGYILYPQSKSSVYFNEADLQREMGTEGFIHIEKFSEYSGLRFNALISLHDLRKDVNAMIRFTWIVCSIVLLIAYVAAIYFSGRLVGPIRHLQSKMKLVQSGRFQERAQITSRDELGDLADGFNRMVVHIEHLIKNEYEAKMREKEAEFSALQHQINPHFMYNTLELINMLAYEEKHQEASQVVTNLGRLLRYTVEQQKRPVLLKEEIKFIQAYLDIQMYRFDKELAVKIDVEPELEQVFLPKLSLQPIIENAIEHGLPDGRGQIRIEVRRIGDDCLISIEDNGSGLGEEQVLELQRRIHFPDSYVEDSDDLFGERRKGFALKNVNRRFQLLYGKRYGLQIESQLDKGSRFSILLPVNTEPVA
jgi:two-component system sensor histidine kinase YesM